MEESPSPLSVKSLLSKFCSFLVPVISITVTISFFSLPIILFYVPQETVEYATHNNTEEQHEYNATNCTAFSWCEIPDNASCPAHNYDGMTCKSYLNSWKKCVGIEDNNNKCIYYNESLGPLHQREQTLIGINTYLGHNRECQRAALPFLCQYFFPLQDCTTNVIYTPSREDCIDIKTRTCAQLWKLAVIHGHGDSLPKCQDLNLATSTFSVNQSIPFDGPTSLKLSNITCREGFSEVNSICLPRCDKFSDSSREASDFTLKAQAVASVVAIIVSTAALALSVFSYKTMFVYPSIMIIFISIDSGLIGLFFFITAIDRNKLMCSSVYLLESIQKSTPFCIISGAVFHYAVVNMSMWWLSYVSVFFYQVVFPFHANRMKMLRRKKYLYAIITILCMVLPLPAVIICLTDEKYEYKLVRFPPTFCTTLNKEMWFYFFIAIVDVIVCTGSCILITVCWILHKKKGLTRGTSTAEKKLILVFFSVTIYSISALIYSSIFIAQAESKTQALNAFFECEAFGYIPGKCDTEHHERISYPYINVIVYTSVNFVTLSTLIYVVKWAWIKKLYNYFHAQMKSKQKLKYASSVRSILVPHSFLNS